MGCWMMLLQLACLEMEIYYRFKSAPLEPAILISQLRPDQTSRPVNVRYVWPKLQTGLRPQSRPVKPRVSPTSSSLGPGFPALGKSCRIPRFTSRLHSLKALPATLALGRLHPLPGCCALRCAATVIQVPSRGRRAPKTSRKRESYPHATTKHQHQQTSITAVPVHHFIRGLTRSRGPLQGPPRRGVQPSDPQPLDDPFWSPPGNPCPASRQANSTHGNSFLQLPQNHPAPRRVHPNPMASPPKPWERQGATPLTSGVYPRLSLCCS